MVIVVKDLMNQSVISNNTSNGNVWFVELMNPMWPFLCLDAPLCQPLDIPVR